MTALQHKSEIEFGVQEKETLDGPWGRIDTGANWSHRGGRKYTEDEARKEASLWINGINPNAWRRVVTRNVTQWLPEST
jgi:hypothetical protein